MAGTGAPTARSGIGIPSPMFPGCPLCAGHQEKCLFPCLIILTPRVTVQGTHAHPHFTDGTIKAWRQREFLGKQCYLDLNLDCVAPSLLLSPRMRAQARTAAIGTPLEAWQLWGLQELRGQVVVSHALSLEHLTCCFWASAFTPADPEPQELGRPFYRQGN